MVKVVVLASLRKLFKITLMREVKFLGVVTWICGAGESQFNVTISRKILLSDFSKYFNFFFKLRICP